MPVQFVTLVASGGTPVRLADQRGAPYPTTGTGALVFADAPHLINPIFDTPYFAGSIGVERGTHALPGFYIENPSNGIYSPTNGTFQFVYNDLTELEIAPGQTTVTGDLEYSGVLIGAYHSPLTTEGDLYYYGPAGNTRLPRGSTGQALISTPTGIAWTAIPGTGTVTSISAGAGITLTPNPITTTGTVALTASGVVAGSVGSDFEVPVFTVDTYGRVTALSETPINVSNITTGILPVIYGGTGQNTALTQYGVVYSATSTAMATTGAGTTGQVLGANTGGAPTWQTLSSIGVTSFSTGTTGLTPVGPSTGGIVLAGTLNVANGGTGVTTSTGTGSVVLSASPTFTGTIAVNAGSGTDANAAYLVGNYTGSVVVDIANSSTGNNAQARITTELSNVANGYALWGIFKNSGTPYAFIETGAGVTGGLTLTSAAITLNGPVTTTGSMGIGGAVLSQSRLAVRGGSLSILGADNNFAAGGVRLVADLATADGRIGVTDGGVASATTLGLWTSSGAGGFTQRVWVRSDGNVGIGGDPGSGGRFLVYDNSNGQVYSTLQNASTGGNAQTYFRQNTGGRYVDRIVSYSGQYMLENASNIPDRYSDFNNHYFRNAAGTRSVAALIANGSGGYLVLYGSTSGQANLLPPAISAGQNITLPASTGTLITAADNPGMIYGLTLSTAGSSTTMSFAAGRAADSTGAVIMVGTSMSKTTSAWAAGNANGMLDTGAIAANTWYHHFLIGKTDGTTDYLCSLSPTAPTLPATYTYFRRIGSIKTNGSAQWQTFFQSGDRFYIPEVTDFSPSGTSGLTLRTLSVPTGVVVNPVVQVIASALNNAQTRINFAPAANSATLYLAGGAHNGADTPMWVYGAPQIGPPTNTSAQIYIGVPLFINGGNVTTSGWIDTRGKEYLP